MGFLKWLFHKATTKNAKYERGHRIKKWGNNTRVGNRILCPRCNYDVLVRDYTWMQMVCPKCHEKSHKYDWYETKQ